MKQLFEDNQIFLRPFTSEDVEGLQLYLNDPSLCGRRNIPDEFPAYLPLSLAPYEKVIDKWSKTENEFHFAITKRVTAELIGHTNCHYGWDPINPGLNITIAPAHQRQGYGSRTAKLLINYLFNYTAAHNISGDYASWNDQGSHFAENLGFTKAGKMRRAGLHEGKYYDWTIVEILRPDWEEKVR